MILELIATATFGLEAVVKREIEGLGCRILRSEDGKITFQGDERALVRSNLWLRCADRVLIKAGEFTAVTFEELYQQTRGIPWEHLIPLDGAFPVDGSSVKSVLHSVPACQRIVKKAIADRLMEANLADSLPETGPVYGIRATLLKDRVTLTLDTSGPGLHKRAYRIRDVAAPVKETLAAAMVMLSFWKNGRPLLDPCCGSGTIPIEAAMIAMNIAPGLSRSFAAEEWPLIGKDLWKEERRKAFESILPGEGLSITGSDIDAKAIGAARENAMEAGVSEAVRFEIRDVANLQSQEARGVLITNPPYGERIGDKETLRHIYASLKGFLRDKPDWSLFLLTSDKSAEDALAGRPADRRRKLYNGRIEVCYYQFHGGKP